MKLLNTKRSLPMNNQSNTPLLFSYLLPLVISVFISIPVSYADDDDRGEHMGMGYGHMGYGHMGYGHMGSHRMGMMGMGYGLNHLDLSSKQRATIRDIHKEMRSNQLSLQDKIGELNDELYSLYKKDKPNAKKVGAVYKKIFNLKQQQIELAINTKNKTYDILNKKQKEKFKELKSSPNDCGMHKGMHSRGMHHMMD